MFNYYLSSSFKWLPFVHGKEKEGIRLVETALNSRFPYNYAAKSSLCWILIEQQNFRKADSLARSVLDELPDNTIEILFQTALDFYYTPAERLVEAGKKIRMFLRDEVGLPAEPSEAAKLAEIIFDD